MRGKLMGNKATKVTILACLVSLSYGQTDDFEVFDSEQIDVDGIYKEKPRPTAADRIRAQRAKLEKANENLVKKKIEDARIKEEQRMTQRLQNMFNGKGFTDDSVVDQVQTGQAAPVQQQVVAAPEAPEEKTASISITAGVRNFLVSEEENLDDNDYTSDSNFKIDIDGKVADRFMMGVGIGYTTINFEENPYENFYTIGLQQSREIEGRILSFDIHGKFIFTRDSRVKPYVGFQAGYNRLNLEYNNNNQQQFNGLYTNYGSEEYSKGFVTAGANAGISFDINESFGLNAQVTYDKGFGSDSDTNNNFFFNGGGFVDDRIILENIGSQLQAADSFGINLGIQANF